MIPLVLGLLFILLFTQPAGNASFTVFNNIFPNLPKRNSPETLKVFIYSAFLALFFAFSENSYAVSTSITAYPNTISESPFTINASISGAGAGTNYLKIELFKDGTTNYFGETFNGVNWYSGSLYSQYLPITIQSGVTWSGSIQARTGEPTSTEYDGSGIYKIRVRRYTQGGSYTSTEATGSAVVIHIYLPTPTPSLTKTTTTTNTKTPTPIKITTTNPTKATATPIQTKTTPNPTTHQTAILGTQTATTEASPETTNIKLSSNDRNKQPDKPLVKGDSYSRYLSYGLIGIGGLAIIIPVIIFLKKKYV